MQLFFGDGGEIDRDAWDLVGDKDTVFVSAGQDWQAPTPVSPHTPVGPAKAAEGPSVAPLVVTMPMAHGLVAPTAAAQQAFVERMKAAQPKADKLALMSLVMHVIGYCVGHLPWFVETMRSINDTFGNTLFIFFGFIPSTAIWACGFLGPYLYYSPTSAKCRSKDGCCGGCCVDHRGRPQMGCPIALTTTALVLHSIIAYVESFLVANFQSWVIGCLIAKNTMCIVGEVVALVGACALGQAIRDPPFDPAAAHAALPQATIVSAQAAGQEAV